MAQGFMGLKAQRLAKKLGIDVSNIAPSKGVFASVADVQDHYDNLNRINLKPGPGYNATLNQPQPDIHTRARNNAQKHLGDLPAGIGRDPEGTGYRQEIHNQPAMSFAGSITQEDRPEYNDLLNRISNSGVNAHLVTADLGRGLTGKAVSITQTINNEQVESHILFGNGGATYLRNPQNSTSLRIVSTLANLNEQTKNVDLTNPVDRVVNWINNPTYVTEKGQQRVSSILGLSQKEGADLLPVEKLVAQPGLNRYVASSIQVAQKNKWQANDIVNSINKSGKWGGELILSNKGTTAHTVESLRAVIASSQDALAISKNKRIKNAIGFINTLTRGVGTPLEQGREPFYFEGQDAPNAAYTVLEARDLYGMQPEGSAYQSGFYPAKAFKREATLPKGSIYDPDSKEIKLQDGTVISSQTYYGRKIGRISDQYSRAGNQNLFHQIFGFKTGSSEANFIDKVSPVLDDNGSFTGKVNIEGHAMTLDASMKYMGKEMWQRVNRGIMPRNGSRQAADVWGIFPGNDELPTYALQVLKGEAQTTENFAGFFERTAKANGKDDAWIAANFQDGKVSSEAAPMITQAAANNILARMRPVQQSNITVSQMQYEATQNANFRYRFNEGDQIPDGAQFLGPSGDYLVPVIPNTPGNVTQNPNGTYTIGTRNDLRFWGRRAVNVRAEGTRPVMNLKPGSLEAMAQYNPPLFQSMMSIAKANLVNNKAYNQIASYRANYEPEQRQQLESVFGIQKVDYNKVLGIQSSLLTANPDISNEDMTRGLLKGLQSEYGNASLDVDTPQGRLTLPNAGTLRSGLTEDPNTREFVSNWASKSVQTLIQSSQVAANKANGISDPDTETALHTLVSQTYSALGENANTENTIQSALGLQLPRFGGIMMGSGLLGANETVASLSHLMKVTGINDPGQLRQMAASGKLNTNILTHPFSDPEDQFATARMMIYEDMPDSFKNVHPNPGKNIITSLELAASMHRDFDADRAIAMANYQMVNGQLIGSDTNPMSVGEVVRRAKNKFESEYTKQIQNYSERSGFSPFKAFGGALFKTAISTLGNAFRSEEEAKKTIGPVYNSIFRGFGGAVNATTQKLYGAEDPITRRIASAVGDINSYATQSLVDTKNNRDSTLSELIDNAGRVKRWKNGTFHKGVGDRSLVANNTEEYYQKQFQNITKVGSNISDEEYRQKLAPAVATSLISRDELQSLQKSGGDSAVQGRINQVADLLVHQRSNPGSDLSDEIMGLTGTENQTSGQRFTSWGYGIANKGLSSLSGFAQWIGGSLVRNFYNTGKWNENKNDYERDKNGRVIRSHAMPDYGTNLTQAGEQQIATAQFQTSVDHPESIEAAASNQGGSPDYQTYVKSLLPGSGSGANTVAENFRQRLTPEQQTTAAGNSIFDPHGSDKLIAASQWASQAPEDDELMRLVQLNTTKSERGNGYIDTLKEKFSTMKSFFKWSPFKGGGNNNAAAVGTAMESALVNRLGISSKDSQVDVVNTARRSEGRADLIWKLKSGESIVADIKTKNSGTLASDIMAPEVNPEVMGQLGIYSEALKMRGRTSGASAIIAGVRSTKNPAASRDELLSGFEQAHDTLTQFFSQSSIPDSWKNAGKTQDYWDEVRTNSLAAMQDIYEQTGMKVGARAVSDKETTAFLDARQGNVIDLQALSESALANDPQQRAEQIEALRQKGSVPHTSRNVPRSSVSSSASASSSTPSGGGSTGSGTPLPPSQSIPMQSGSSGSGSNITNTVYQVRNPQISDKAIVEAAHAFEQLTSGAAKFAAGSKEAREELIKHYEALKTVSNYMGDVEQAQKRGENLSNKPDYQTFQSILGTGRSGGSIAEVIRQKEQQLRPGALQAMQDNLNEENQPEAPQNLLGRIGSTASNIFDRTFRAQGLFHAELGWKVTGGRAFSAAQDYLQSQAQNATTLYQSGGYNFNDLMQSNYGTYARQQASISQAELGFGKQVYQAYSPFITAAINPQVANGIGGFAAGIGLPSLGAGIAAYSLIGAGAALPAAAIAAGIGIAGYSASALGDRYARGKDVTNRNLSNNFSGAWGNAVNYLTGNPMLPDMMSGNWQGAVDKLTGNTAPSAADIQNEAFSNLTDQYTSGSLNRDQMTAMATAFGFNPADITGQAFTNLKSSMAQYGLTDDQAGEALSPYFSVNTTGMPSTDQLKTMSQNYLSGYDSKTFNNVLSGGNILPTSPMGLSAYWDSSNWLAQQPNKTAAISVLNYAGQTNGQANLAQQQAYLNAAKNGGGGVAPTTSTQYAQMLAQYGVPVGSALHDLGQLAAQVQVQNPDYYNSVGNLYLGSNSQAAFAYDQGNFTLGNNLSSQVAQGSGIYNQILNLGGTASQAAQTSDQYAQIAKQGSAQMQLVDQALSGNQMALSVRGQQTGLVWQQQLNLQTGMPTTYQNVPQNTIDAIRANDPYHMFRLNDQQAQIGTYGAQSQITLDQRLLQNAGWQASNQQRDIGYQMQYGNLSSAALLMAQGNAYTGFAGTQLNTGNGMNYYQIQKAQWGITRSQQAFGLQQEGQQLGIAQQQYALTNQQFNANYGLQVQQFQYQTGFQRQQMQIDQSHTVQQEQWNTQDIAYNRSQLDVQFGWQMQDYDRNIRYARGMDKRNLMREQQRAVIEYSMQASHSDVQAGRNQTQIQWEEQDFQRKKQYFEQNTQFQQQSLDNQKKFFDLGQQLDKQRLDMQQQAHLKNVQWMQQEWQLEDQQRSLDRQFAEWQYQNQVLIDTKTQDVTKDINMWGDAINQVNQYIQTTIAYAQTLEGISQVIGGQAPTVTGDIGIGGHQGSAVSGYAGHGSVGVVHKGGDTSPQDNTTVVQGSNAEVSKKHDRMIQLLEKIADNPSSFQLVMDGQKSTAQPIYRQSKARL